jgi:hypothetical protein
LIPCFIRGSSADQPIDRSTDRPRRIAVEIGYESRKFRVNTLNRVPNEKSVTNFFARPMFRVSDKGIPRKALPETDSA